MGRAQQFLYPGRGGVSILPYSVDFSTLSDGALPSGWLGATWQISSGVAKNTPTLSGSELLSDPGLEATYTAGKCNSLTAAGSGSPTYTESADVHEGSKAQLYTPGSANAYLYWALLAGVAGQWNYFSIWGKRTAGTDNDVHAGLGEGNSLPGGGQYVAINSAAYQKYAVSLISTDTTNIYRRAARTTSGSSWDTVIVDDGLHQAVTFSTIPTIKNFGNSDVIIKCQPSAIVAGDGTHFGMILRSDTDLVNCIFILYSQRLGAPTLANISVIKKIGTTYTSVLAETSVAITADSWLEARSSGSTVSIWYKDVQVGTDKTISDVELLTNKNHGMCSAGGNTLKGFFAQAS